jgi:hypothetical protein
MRTENMIFHAIRSTKAVNFRYQNNLSLKLALKIILPYPNKNLARPIQPVTLHILNTREWDIDFNTYSGTYNNRSLIDNMTSRPSI